MGMGNRGLQMITTLRNISSPRFYCGSAFHFNGARITIASQTAIEGSPGAFKFLGWASMLLFRSGGSDRAGLRIREGNKVCTMLYASIILFGKKG